jgi:uncharacterized protein YjbI with pentapeptide repeats
LAISLGLASALAQELYRDPNTAEGWALPQIERSEMADFNERCNTPALNPMDENDARWLNDCRKLSARFLQDLLTRLPWRESIPFEGIQIKGARIVEGMDLEHANLDRSLSILASRIEGNINLSHAQTERLIWLEGSLMNGRFDANSLRSKTDLFLREGSVFKDEVTLTNAKIDGNVEFTGARFERKLDAGQVTLGGSLMMNSSEQNKAIFHEVVLFDAKIARQLSLFGATFERPLNAGLLKVGGSFWAPSLGPYNTRFQSVVMTGAEITGQMSLSGTSFDGSLDAGLLQVGGSLFMNSVSQNRASFKTVDLTGAKVAGNVDMGGAKFDGELHAGLLQVGNILNMASRTPNITNFRMDVNLGSARVTGNVDMGGASFDGVLQADLLQVGGNLNMALRPPDFTIFKKDVNLGGARIAGTFSAAGTTFGGKVNADSLKVTGDMFLRYACHADKALMAYSSFGGHVDLRGASLADADLSSSTVAGELRLDGKRFEGCTRSSAARDILSLRNAKVANLLVADDGLTPTRRLRLDGFSFSHMGGFEGDVRSRLRERPAKWWDDWVRLDPDYSPTPYTQLAAVFNSAGDREAAEDIRYLERKREREVLCQEGWLRGSCLLQSVLGAVAGYGVGSHTFVVLYWVLGFWLAGVLLLWWTVPAAKHNGAIWCCSASLALLLPVITINKELTAFFDDPERKRMKGWQVFVFSALGLVGLALGTLLLIAVSGLTRTA